MFGRAETGKENLANGPVDLPERIGCGLWIVCGEPQTVFCLLFYSSPDATSLAVSLCQEELESGNSRTT